MHNNCKWIYSKLIQVLIESIHITYRVVLAKFSLLISLYLYFAEFIQNYSFYSIDWFVIDRSIISIILSILLASACAILLLLGSIIWLTICIVNHDWHLTDWCKLMIDFEFYSIFLYFDSIYVYRVYYVYDWHLLLLLVYLFIFVIDWWLTIDLIVNRSLFCMWLTFIIQSFVYLLTISDWLPIDYRFR